MKETVKMMTMQEMSELATQELDMKECREVYANNETHEKFDEIKEEVSLLNKNLKQLSKEMKELKEKFGIMEEEEADRSATLSCKVCGKLGNKDPDLGYHVDPKHMFSPGLTCKLCVHVSQTDVNQDDPKEEHMQSGFFSLINHVHSAKSISFSPLCLVLFYSQQHREVPWCRGQFGLVRGGRLHVDDVGC